MQTSLIFRLTPQPKYATGPTERWMDGLEMMMEKSRRTGGKRERERDEEEGEMDERKRDGARIEARVMRE